MKLKIPILVCCERCEATTPVAMDFNDLDVDHRYWKIDPPSDFYVMWAMEQSNSPFRKCDVKEMPHGYTLAEILCPDCMVKYDAKPVSLDDD